MELEDSLVKHVKVSLLLLATTLVLAACTTGGAHDQLVERDWRLTWIEGFDTIPSGAATPTIRFGSDRRVHGNTGCNIANGSYTVEEDRLTVSALAMTRRACLDERGNELERAYVRAVEGTRRYRIEGGELQLLDDADTVLVRFR
jgi:heat shock protein HslJ